MIRRFAVFGALIAVAFVSQPAAAAPGGDAVLVGRVQVPYGDLDMSTMAGQAALKARVSAAASMACGGSPMFHSRYHVAPNFVRADFQRCRVNAQQTAFVALTHRGIVMVADAR